MSGEDIIGDVFLLDFYERKYNTILSVVDDDTQFLLLKNLNTKWSVASSWRKRLRTLKYKIIGPLPIVTSILRTFTTKISLIGPEILNIGKDFPIELTNFNFYLHSCSADEALNIIIKCTEITQAIIFYKEDRVIFLSLRDNIKVNIFYNVFKDREAILKSINNVEERHGYDFEVGYFSTINSILLLISQDRIIKSNYDSVGFINEGDRELNVDKVRDRLILFDDIKNCSTILLNTYRTFNVGITNDVYVALANISRAFNLNKDLLKYLCEILLTEEVVSVKQGLLGS